MTTRPRSPALLLCFVSGIVFIAGGLLHNPWFASLVARAAHRLGFYSISGDDSVRIFSAQLAFIATGVLLLLAGWLAGRIPAVHRFVRRAWVEKVLLAVFVIAVPVLCIEFSLHAFLPPHEKIMSLFEKDDALGWKLRPGAVDVWGGVEVHVNERGFRGPVVPFERSPGSRRIVYLGDSVTFGYRVARWQDTWPYQIGTLLTARDSIPTEIVNLAVEGYSQWQERLVLEREGFRYQPDLVVVGFVLNDVTEMFHLARFGGTEEGYQLRHSYTSRLDRALSQSAFYAAVQKLVRRYQAKRRLGDDVRLGAIKQEILEVETLMHEPDQANVKTAWDIALADLQGIADACATRNVPLLVVVFPFTVQLESPDSLAAPQRVINHYTGARGIPAFDLLPPLAAIQAAHRAEDDSLFIDHDHLSVRGHALCAQILADTVSALVKRP